jgi:RNA polymerase sigma-70 factor (ECF subfamily)
MQAEERERESDLARRLMAGEREAFDRFIEHFRPKIFQYSWLMCGDREDAEEVAQEALLKVFENLDQLREPDRARAWVFRIAKNVCLMKRRKSVYAPAHELSLDEFLPRSEGEGKGRRLQIADWSQVPDSQALRAELSEVLHKAIAELPENYRSVLLLRDVEEFSTDEAANILDVSADVVKTRLHRARLAMRKTPDHYLQTARPALAATEER